uniref:Uncharacterized protein LOC116295435 n=1 Tax=Actinia tenebrosa TaxID=6105 RepID=A0A6P8I2H5_ACTTE
MNLKPATERTFLMTTSNTVISLDNSEDQPLSPKSTDNNGILSSTRIKQRRATVTPAEIPAGQLPRYLRDPNRYAVGASRRQSLPAASLNTKFGTANYSQKIPSKLKAKLDEIDNPTDHELTDSIDGRDDSIGQKSFPLDNRLLECDKNEINNSSERLKSDIPQNCENQSNKDIKVLIGSTPTFNGRYSGVKKTSLSIGNYEQPRRHSIAVSVLTNPQRTGIDSPLSGRFDNSLYNSKDRVITVEPRERKASVSPGRKVGRYIPKPDNHLLLSIFSFLCCCPLLGLVALIYSVQVDMNYENGKKEESVFKSKNARCWALMGVMIGMLTILGGSLYAVIVLAILS